MAKSKYKPKKKQQLEKHVIDKFLKWWDKNVQNEDKRFRKRDSNPEKTGGESKTDAY